MMNSLTVCGVALGVCLLLFGFAFIAAPHADWGLGAYFYSGLGVLVVLLALPFVMQAQQTIMFRMGMALGFGAMAAGIWLAGLFIANVRIVTKLI
jgi:hypothetical protein